MAHTHRLRLVVLTLCVVLLSALASAQVTAPPSPAPSADAVDQKTFDAVWARVSANAGATTLLRAASTNEAKIGAYTTILREFIGAPEFVKLVAADGTAAVTEAMPETALAAATNAASTNPASTQLLERSGITSLFSMAGDLRDFVAADGNAVSLSLNAFALTGWRLPGLNRLGGTVTFGGKLPEKAITGLTGLPDSDTLFDAWSWDVKLRVRGDRDTRAEDWKPQMAKVGRSTELLARVLSLPIPPADVGIVREAAKAVLDEEVDAVVKEVSSSLQVTIKAAGTHLVEVSDRNKYSVGLLVDKGVSAGELTFNAVYSSARVKTAAGLLTTTRDIQVSGGLTRSLWKDVIMKGRAAEVAFGLKGTFVRDDALVDEARGNTFDINGTVTLPFGEKGKIPISVTWTNDPKSLSTARHIRGQVGLSYDFGAIWAAVKDKEK